jgi:hypothetical protein
MKQSPKAVLYFINEEANRVESMCCGASAIYLLLLDSLAISPQAEELNHEKRGGGRGGVFFMFAFVSSEIE